MRSTQVTTWRTYTKREKQAYRARVRRRRQIGFIEQSLGVTLAEWQKWTLAAFVKHNFSSRVPSTRVNRDVL